MRSIAQWFAAIIVLAITSAVLHYGAVVAAHRDGAVGTFALSTCTLCHSPSLARSTSNNIEIFASTK